MCHKCNCLIQYLNKINDISNISINNFYSLNEVDTKGDLDRSPGNDDNRKINLHNVITLERILICLHWLLLMSSQIVSNWQGYSIQSNK